MQYIYYIETNAICLFLLMLVYARNRQERAIISSSQRLLGRMVLASMVLCLCDILAGVCRGQQFPGARGLIQLSNLLYFEMMPLVAMLWSMYVSNRVGRTLGRRGRILFFLPMLLFTLAAISNPFSGILFSIDAANCYARGPGVYLHWIISWFYLIFAAVQTGRAMKENRVGLRREELMPLAGFLVLPTVCGLLQMLFYGVTATQVGITLSIVLIFMKVQDNRISIDELTGINNRRALHNFIDRLLNRSNISTVTVVMIDVNNFKQINDSLGHAVGDAALRDTADVLRDICGSLTERFFLCRYGGDEFVLVGVNAEQENFSSIYALIHQRVAEATEQQNKPYQLSVAVGCAYGPCTSQEDFAHYLRVADEAMYDDKKRGRMK